MQTNYWRSARQGTRMALSVVIKIDESFSNLAVITRLGVCICFIYSSFGMTEAVFAVQCAVPSTERINKDRNWGVEFISMI